LITIVSSGESGVAEGAIQAAMSHKIPTEGYCLSNGCNSDRKPVAKWYGLEPADPERKCRPSVDSRATAIWNVRRSTHLLVIHNGVTHGLIDDIFDDKSIWSRYGFTGAVAWNTAIETRIPRLAVDLTDPKDILKVREWITDQDIKIMIAGPNEFESPGISLQTLKTIRAFLKLFVVKDQPHTEAQSKEASSNVGKPSIVVGKPRPE